MSIWHPRGSRISVDGKRNGKKRERIGQRNALARKADSGLAAEFKLAQRVTHSLAGIACDHL